MSYNLYNNNPQFKHVSNREFDKFYCTRLILPFNDSQKLRNRFYFRANLINSDLLMKWRIYYLIFLMLH